MPLPCHDNSRYRTEQELLSEQCGFSGAFLAVQYLRSQIDAYPGNTSPTTIQALLFLIRSTRFDHKKQVFFLINAAADALIALALFLEEQTCTRIISALQGILAGASGARVRAVGNAMGHLPVTLSGPPIPLPDLPSPCPVSLDALFGAFGAPVTGPPVWQGRSLVLPLQGNRLGVIKFANSRENIEELARENFWQQWLGRPEYRSGRGWHIPAPVSLDTHSLFRVTPVPPLGPSFLHRGICIAYTALPQYFEYPNEQVTAQAWERIEQVFFTTARSLGRLTAEGLFHTALIPLFHNRVQQGRRTDNGVYLWEHGGRLDQWLDSCRFPNFSFSGLRDFEHLEQAVSSKDLRHYIGEHLLSFILVMGSCIRSQAPERRGLNSDGSPSDTRDLFDPDQFCALILGVCREYFRAFSQDPLPVALENRIPGLVEALIQTMGLDSDMEERLRIRDQENMDQDTYIRFLSERGISAVPPRGEADIILKTGPHLGGFNQPISVPGLVDFLYNFSSLCVSYCFTKENQLKALGN